MIMSDLFHFLLTPQCLQTKDNRIYRTKSNQEPIGIMPCMYVGKLKAVRCI